MGPCALLFFWPRHLLFSRSLYYLVREILNSPYLARHSQQHLFKFLTGRSQRGAAVSLDTFPIPWSAWVLSSVYFQCWLLCLSYPRLALSQSAACSLSWFHEVDCEDFLLHQPALNHSTFHPVHISRRLPCTTDSKSLCVSCACVCMWTCWVFNHMCFIHTVISWTDVPIIS